MTQERVIAHFATLDINVTDRKRLGSMFDADEDGCVTLEEFVIGCVRLRGSAKKSDLAATMLKTKKLHDSVKHLDKNITALKKQVSAHGEGIESLHDLHWATQRALGIESQENGFQDDEDDDDDD